MDEKKVVVVIVEGPSDEAALGPMIKQKFDMDQVRFLVVNGDITAGSAQDPDTCIEKIKERLEIIKERYAYEDDDFLRIIHVTDADGVYALGSVVEKNVSSIRYYTDHVEAKHAQSVIDRNRRKRRLLNLLSRTESINGIPYQIFYNACNLEHVLWNRMRVTSSKDKIRLADEFAEAYENNFREFVRFICSDEVAVPGNYQETWEFIKEGYNSLNRNTNLHLVFQS